MATVGTPKAAKTPQQIAAEAAAKAAAIKPKTVAPVAYTERDEDVLSNVNKVASKDSALMKFRLTLVLLSFLVAGSAWASNDRRECKEDGWNVPDQQVCASDSAGGGRGIPHNSSADDR